MYDDDDDDDDDMMAANIIFLVQLFMSEGHKKKS
jgi:hypothetical protein